MFKVKKHCRWCGIEYYATKPYNRDGFHLTSCKQAHYRAFKNYVTRRQPAADIGYQHAVTPKKRKKKGKKNDKKKKKSSRKKV